MDESVPFFEEDPIGNVCLSQDLTWSEDPDQDADEAAFLTNWGLGEAIDDDEDQSPLPPRTPKAFFSLCFKRFVSATAKCKARQFHRKFDV